MGNGATQQTPTVYVVDDDASIRRALERLLRSAGYYALTFGSAEEFLQSAIAPGKGCLILDIRLPEMTGFDLQQELASSGAMSSVIFMTAHDNPQWQERAIEAGAIAYLKKPFREQSLLNALERFFESHVKAGPGHEGQSKAENREEMVQIS
jgi:FixJ family two-component response regulator